MKNIPSYGNLKAYLIGYVLLLAMSFISYLLVMEQAFVPWLRYTFVSALGVAAAVVLLILFLHLGRESKPRWNLILFYQMAVILLIVIFGTIWIMYHLNYNMMTM